MQTIKRVIKKIGAISVGLAFLGATVTGALAADLNEYPVPFISGGAYSDVAIITSSNGLDANSALLIVNGFAGLITATDSTATTTTSVAGAYQLDKSGDAFNFDDDAYDIDSKLDKNDMATLLADGTFVDSEGSNTGSTDYTQVIKFYDNKSENDKTIGLIFDKNSDDPDDLVTDYLYISKTGNFYAWAYEFDLTSTIPVTADTDIENNNIEILGKTYTITDATVTTTNVTKLTLLSGEVTQTLASGDIISGVTLQSVNLDGDKCTIEYDETTYTIDKGQTLTMPDGTIIGVTDVVATSAGLDDYCELNIGADKLELPNGDKVKVNGDAIDGTKVTFNIPPAGTAGGFKKFNVTYTPDDKTYLKPGEEFVDPVFGAFKIMYEGLIETTEEINIDSSSEEVKLTTTNKDGQPLEVTFCFANTTNIGDLHLGRDKDERLIVAENVTLDNNTIGEASMTDLEGTKFLYSFDEIAHIIEITDIDTNLNQTNFRIVDVEGEVGSTYENKDYTPSADTTFDFMGHEFKLNISIVGAGQAATPTTTSEVASAIRFVDINDKGPTIFTEYGANITFIYGIGNDQINYTNPFFGNTDGQACALHITEVDTGVEGDIDLNTLLVNFTYDATDHEIEINGVTAGGGLLLGSATSNLAYLSSGSTTLTQKDDSDNYLKTGRTIYGTLIEQYQKDDGYVNLWYPDEATEAVVYVAPVSASATTVTTGTSTSYVSLEDTEVVDVSAYNAIVVGGPAANSVAAELLGLTYPSYGTASGLIEGDAVLKLVDNGAKVALIVYGWEKDDTKRAAKVLESYSAYEDLAGEEVSVTGTLASPTIVTSSGEEE